MVSDWWILSHYLFFSQVGMKDVSVVYYVFKDKNIFRIYYFDIPACLDHLSLP